VLVVEDGWQVADSLKLFLEQMGMIVVGPVATPQDARRLAIQCPLELAIVDVNLKGEMAYELMEWLHDRGTPIIVILGLPRPSRAAEAVLGNSLQAIHAGRSAEDGAAGHGPKSDVLKSSTTGPVVLPRTLGISIRQRTPVASKKSSTAPPSS
jgi:CheY-like chemotaxis protein